jgi:ribose 5-phosphate isomerase B
VDAGSTIAERELKMIALGSDHVGIELKKAIMEYLDELGLEYKDYGTYNTERCNYPEYALKAANAVASGECEKGILFCGTGIGIGIAATKVKGIRCVCCSDCYSAKLSREHNDTNMLSLGARVVGTDLAKMIVLNWLEGKFEGGRHQVRVDQIGSIERTGKI